MIFKEEIMDKLEKLFCKGCIIYGVYKTADFAIRFERAILKEIKNRKSERKQKTKGAC
jgi:hypothetical protein